MKNSNAFVSSYLQGVFHYIWLISGQNISCYCLELNIQRGFIFKQI